MKAQVSKTFLGLFAFDEKGKLVDKSLFPKDAKKIVDSLENPEKYQKELEEKLRKKGYKQIEKSDVIGISSFRKLAKNIGYSDKQLNQLLTQVGIEFTRRRIKQTVKKDKIIIQVINSIDEFAIGFVIYRIDEYISKIDIAEINPKYRKKGYGRKMINDCLNHFKNHGVLVTELYCEPKSSEKIWKNFDFLNFPKLPYDNNIIRMFRPLVERLKIDTEINKEDEIIELWNEEPHIAKKTSSKWTWKINSPILEKPIIHPAYREWQICWRKGNIIKETDKVKRFYSKENKYGHFVIIKELKNYKDN